jgi:hypothetical protein
LKENCLNQAERKRKYPWEGIKTKLKFISSGYQERREGDRYCIQGEAEGDIELGRREQEEQGEKERKTIKAKKNV